MKKIAKLLKADFNESSDLASIAAMLAGKGRGNDTLLAHITPREADILKAAGGSGTTNPETGLLEFFEGEAYDYGDVRAEPSPVEQEAGQFDPGGFYGGQTGETGQGIRAPAPVVDRYSAQGTGSTLPTDVAAQPTTSGEITSYISPYGTGLQPVSISGRQDYGVTPPALTGAPALAAEGRTATPVPSTEEKSFFDKLSSQDMIRLGLAGGLGTLGYAKSKQAAKQAEAAKAEQQALAQPYQQKGQAMVRAAESGELTPSGQQALQATQAKIAQGVESRGGVGAQQATAQLEAFRQQLLQQQYNYGLQIAQVGDSIALGAIKTGLAADNAVQQATQNFYTNLAMVAGGLPLAERRTA